MPAPLAHGPDLSRYQTLNGPRPPEWVLVSMKATEGRNYVDPTFAAKWRWAEGVRYRGAYHWLRSDSPISAQAANLVRRITEVGGLRVGDFVQTDWETTNGIANVTPAAVDEFNDRLNNAFGRECVITYCSDWVPGFIEWRRKNPTAPLWYANYNTGTTTSGGWAECAKWGADVWQWTSRYQHPAVDGGFDMNHIFDFATLERLCGHTITPPPTEDDMPTAQVFRVDGDAAQYAVAGGVAKWIVDPEQRAVYTFLGQVPKVGIIKCDRSLLKHFILVGPPPTYWDGYEGVRTTADDFAQP